MIESKATPAYSLTARVFHWTTALLVVILLALGVVIANEWGGRLQDPLYDLHRSIGATVLAVVILRLGYRFTHRPSPLPDDIPPIQRLAARAVHSGLYGLLILQPLVGWVATSAYGAPITVFGLFRLPPLWYQDRGLSDRLFVVHRAIAIIIACLLVAHIGAAMYHHFARRDGVLMRMITG